MWCGNDCGELSAGLEPVGSTKRWHWPLEEVSETCAGASAPTEEIVDSVRVVSPVVFAVAQAVSAPEALPEHQ